MKRRYTNSQERLERALVPVIITAVIGTAGVLGATQAIYNLRTESARRGAALIADTNRDRLITADEWTSIYRELGLKYTGKEGTDLTNEQLRRYISKHK